MKESKETVCHFIPVPLAAAFVWRPPSPPQRDSLRYLCLCCCIAPTAALPTPHRRRRPSNTQLVTSGRTVIAAARSSDKAAEVFAAEGLLEGYQRPEQRAGGVLFTASGIDVTNPSTLSAGLFEGVTQVCK